MNEFTLDNIMERSFDPSSSITRQQTIEQKRKQFYEGMEHTLQNKEYGLTLKMGEKSAINEFGQLTMAFRESLAEIKEEELAKLEAKISNVQQVQNDLYGIQRQVCTICMESCSGYIPTKQLLGKLNYQNAFPTFCQVCECPAHFHKPLNTAKTMIFPEQVAETLRNYNFESFDINFNAVVCIFQIKDLQNVNQNINDFADILRGENLEVLSLTKKEIDFNEAVFLQSKLTHMNQENIMNSSNVQGRQSIRRTELVGSTNINKYTKANTDILFLQTLQKDKQVSAMMQKLVHQKIKEIIRADPTQNVTTAYEHIQNNIPHLTQTADMRFSRLSVRSSPGDKRIIDTIENEIAFENLVMPMPKNKTLKAKIQSKTKNVKKDSIVQSINQNTLQQIGSQIKQNPFIQDLLSSELLVVCIGSSTYQNLAQKLKQIEWKIQTMLLAKNMPLIYISDHKIAAIEDCITFCPEIFMLNKSIIMSQIIPSIEYLNELSQVDSILRKTDDFISGAGTLSQSVQDEYKDLRESESQQYKQTKIHKESSHYSKTNQFVSNLNANTVNQKKLDVMNSMRQTHKHHLHKYTSDSDLVKSKLIDLVSAQKSKIVKQDKLQNVQNQVEYNYGILQDFFAFSAVSIQQSRQCEKTHLVLGYNRNKLSEQLNELDLKLDEKPGVNLFAIAKVGLPNIIYPNTLDLKVTNFHTYNAYMAVAGKFFPDLAQAQQTLLIFRPMMVKNGLNNTYVKIMKANDFIVLKRKLRVLTKNEIEYLAELEGIAAQNLPTYYAMMSESKCEITTFTKFGAVADALTLLNGGGAYARKRISQMDEEVSNVRTNINSTNAMFEVSPFSSFSELIDLDDFMISHSNLERYKRIYKMRQERKTNKVDDQLYYHKMKELQTELNQFKRFFNVVGYAGSTEYEAQKLMCIFQPEVAVIEQVILILNPLYNDFIEDIHVFLHRMKFKTLAHQSMNLSVQNVKDLFGERFNHEPRLQQLFNQSDVQHIFYLTKLAGDREIRQTYRESQISYEDLFNIEFAVPPFKAKMMPYLFLFMDSEDMFVQCLQMILPSFYEFSGADFQNRTYMDKIAVMDIMLQITVGDKIKRVMTDTGGKLIHENKDDVYGTGVSIKELSGMNDIQCRTFYQDLKGSHDVHYVVESEKHGVYELKIRRLHWKGDSYLKYPKDQINIQKDVLQILSHYHTTNLYYNEVNKHFFNICPGFYRFEVFPSQNCTRIFQVEEFSGQFFLEVVAQMHQVHYQQLKKDQLYFQKQYDYQQKSLPAYVWGFNLAEMCQKLQQINSPVPIGCGRFTFKDGHLKGEVHKSADFYESEKAKYSNMLGEFKKGWHYYMSVLETQIIEQKLLHIINSFTFKYSRMPQFLALVPDRVNIVNLRINEKVKVENKDVKLKDGKKFFGQLDENVADPHREETPYNFVESILYTLDNEKAKILANDDFSVHKECSISGVEISKKCRYQLPASILYLLNFQYRKLDRRPDLFMMDRKLSDQRGAEDDFDHVLDILVQSFKDNYKDFNKIVDIQQLQRGFETDFERKVRERLEHEQNYKKQFEREIFEQERFQRSRMGMDQLLKNEVTLEPKQYESKMLDMLQKFVKEYGFKDRQGDQFKRVMNETQILVGPYTLKIAKDYMKQLENSVKNKQEQISLVKMEYFLYACSEAHVVICDLRYLEQRINKLTDKVELAKREAWGSRSEFAATYVDLNSPQRLQQSATQKMQFQENKMQKLQKQLDDLQYIISTKETELVLIFRELMGWDFMVDEYELQAQKEKIQRDQTFLVPLQTFWRPIMVEDNFENNLQNEMFMKPLNYHNPIYPTQRYLAPSLITDNMSKVEQMWRDKTPYYVSNLRPHDNIVPDENMQFDKFVSKGEVNEHKTITGVIDYIKDKTIRVEGRLANTNATNNTYQRKN